MDLTKIYARYLEVKQMYYESDIKRNGKEWPRSEFVRGFVGDVGALVKLTMGKDGLRDIENVDQKIAEELADCLYSVFIIAEKYDVDLEKAFMSSMDMLENRFKKNELAQSHSL